MIGSDTTLANDPVSQRPALLVGKYSAIVLALLTIITFAFAIVAVPISGANCQSDCISYPYLDTVAQFPKDYRWMLPAIVLMLVYLVVMTAVHHAAAPGKKIFSQLGLIFALMASLILVTDYFLQFSIVPISLISGETEGITLLTQYNAHGIFIVLEELGYLLMSISFLALAGVFLGQSRLETSIGWIFLAGFVLAIISLVIVSINDGLNRRDRFEVIVISIDWLVLLVNGALLSRVFGRSLKQSDRVAKINPPVRAAIRARGK